MKYEKERERIKKVLGRCDDDLLIAYMTGVGDGLKISFTELKNLKQVERKAC